MDAYRTELIKQISNFPNLKSDFRDELIRKISQNKSVNLPTNTLIHVTASSFLFDYKEEKLLLVFNNKYSRWLQPGGHCLPNEYPKEAAYRELKEETQIRGLTKTYFFKNAALFDISLHETSVGKEDTHQHIDFRYSLECEVLEINSNSSEVNSVSWVDFETILANRAFSHLKRKLLFLMDNQK